MSSELKLSKLGPEMESGLLVEWLVAEGDVVEEGQPLATIETDKVTAELESPGDGTVTDLVEIDAEYEIGERLATIVGDGESAPAAAAPAAVEPVAVEPAAVEPAAPAPAAVSDWHPDSPFVGRRAPGSGGNRRAQMIEERRQEPLATPIARRMAQANGIDISLLVLEEGDGVIRKRHVVAAMQNGSSREVAAPAPVSSSARDESIKLTTMRKQISTRMQASLQETAQITDFREHDITDLIAFRKSGVSWAGNLGFRVSFTDLFIKATALALREVPELNATLVSDTELVRHGSINMGIAVALPDGLIVPVLHDADRLTLKEIHEQLDELVKLARAGKLNLEQLSGGTFTLTNIGSYGSHMATPILVKGQVGIIGTGTFIERPVVRDGRIEVGNVMYTSLTIDHRVVDGETSGRFQTAIGDLLGNPERLL